MKTKSTNYTIEKANEELQKNAQKVKQSKFWLGYHIAPPAGWLNDPNGLVFYKGEYHAFYQHYPYASQWGPMHWGHAKSKDLIHWEHLPVALAPEYDYEAGGCFSGSAVVSGDGMYLTYTGHNEQRDPKEVQCVAKSTDGIHFEKLAENPVISVPPAHGSPDFRDPKVWMQNDIWNMVVGSSKDGIGKAVLYRSKDLKDWEYTGVMVESDGTQGDMWECPDFFSLSEDVDVLIFSPMNMEGSKTRYMIGKMDQETGKFEAKNSGEIDYGIDFYAPQTFQDDQNRRILISWMNMWKKDMPEQTDGWAGALTIPRELSVENEKLIMKPVEEMKNLRTNQLVSTYEKEIKVADLCLEVEMVVSLDNSNKLGFTLSSEIGESIIVGYDTIEKQIITDRRGMLQGEQDLCQAHYQTENNEITLKAYIDRSSIELFVDGGKLVMTNRFYFKGDNITLSIEGEKSDIQEVSVWELKATM
ncbi:glycoside hydrolase family 32 protein [Anaerobacillus alkalidiazotrophicus]|uniref:glycoside hydrolase family 32 protein n=1 Tax=Anaerobacillus alkalidiazotrophicus TaxID=472963 RepID=UPI0009FE1478|nr:glycoside hydrolase family 32 protein [Anaerobacillus alkalidiazotrophicus]